MSDIGKTAGRSAPVRLRRMLLADAAWDGVLGAFFCLASAGSLAGWAWLPALRPWPPYVIVGAACLVFALVLARAAGDPSPAAFTRLVAIGNAAAAAAAAVAAAILGGSTAAVLAVAALGCAAFAIPEWHLATHPE